MIHYDHENTKPQLRERPTTVYEPLHLDYSPSIGSPKTSKNGVRSLDSLSMDSPQASRNDLRYMETEKASDYFRGGLDSPKLNSGLDSPRMVAGLRKLYLDDPNQMDESGYYSPGDTRGGKSQTVSRNRSGINVAEYCDQIYDSFEGGGVADVSSGGTTPEPVCE